MNKETEQRIIRDHFKCENDWKWKKRTGKPWTEKQEKFCWYLFKSLNWNLTEAYLKAYPRSSYNSARANASRLYKLESTQKCLESIRKELGMRPNPAKPWEN